MWNLMLFFPKYNTSISEGMKNICSIVDSFSSRASKLSPIKRQNTRISKLKHGICLKKLQKRWSDFFSILNWIAKALHYHLIPACERLKSVRLTVFRENYYANYSYYSLIDWTNNKIYWKCQAVFFYLYCHTYPHTR